MLRIFILYDVFKEGKERYGFTIGDTTFVASSKGKLMGKVILPNGSNIDAGFLSLKCANPVRKYLSHSGILFPSDELRSKINPEYLLG